MRRFFTPALAALCVLVALPSQAQFAKPEDAIKYRQNAMFVRGQHMARLGAMANGRVPYDAATAVANAEIVAVVSKFVETGFAPGTEGGKSKPEIWKEQAKFKELNDQLMANADKLLVAAKAGNLDALKAAMGPVAETCKACHDAFRN
jgi:cytochrome c556